MLGIFVGEVDGRMVELIVERQLEKWLGSSLDRQNVIILVFQSTSLTETVNAITSLIDCIFELNVVVDIN